MADALTIFYHDAFPGAGARLAEAGLALTWLASWADVLRADAGSLSAADRGLIETFLADPVAWSTGHGGRGAATLRTERTL